MKKIEAGAKTCQRDIRKKNNLLSYKYPVPVRLMQATPTQAFTTHPPTTHTTTGFQHILRLHL